jgi:ribonuclease BN (tRNA processing enzyme)
MRMTVLGCSGSGPGPTSPASGYLVQAGDAHLTLDLGNGTFGALQRHLDPWALSGVVFSHLHPDHCSDFASLAVHRRYHPRPVYDPAARPLPVVAPVEAPSRFAAAYATSEAERAETDLTDIFTFHPWSDGGSVEIAGVTLRAGAVDHPCEAYAVRVEHDGRSLVYSGDTGPCAGLVEAARGADVLLCEATWPHVTEWWDEPPTGIHLSGRQAGEHAAAAGVGRLLITHVPAWFDAQALLAEAKAAFDGPVELVEPDAGYVI